MRIVNIKTGADTGGIVLGRRGEHEAAQIVFDVSSLAETCGAGRAVLLAKRAGDEAAYPVNAEQEENTVIWTVTSADTAQAGKGECELFWYVGEALAKSLVYSTFTDRDIGDAGTEPPEPWESWVDEVLQAAQDAEDSAQNAAASAEAAQEAAASVARYVFEHDGNGNITIKEDANG